MTQTVAAAAEGSPVAVVCVLLARRSRCEQRNVAPGDMAGTSNRLVVVFVSHTPTPSPQRGEGEAERTTFTHALIHRFLSSCCEAWRALKAAKMSLARAKPRDFKAVDE